MVQVPSPRKRAPKQRSQARFQPLTTMHYCPVPTWAAHPYMCFMHVALLVSITPSLHQQSLSDTFFELVYNNHTLSSNRLLARGQRYDHMPSRPSSHHAAFTTHSRITEIACCHFFTTPIQKPVQHWMKSTIYVCMYIQLGTDSGID